MSAENLASGTEMLLMLHCVIKATVITKGTKAMIPTALGNVTTDKSVGDENVWQWKTLISNKDKTHRKFCQTYVIRLDKICLSEFLGGKSA